MSVAELLAQPLILAAAAFLVVGAVAVAYVLKNGGSVGGGGGGKGKKKIIVLQTRDKSAYELPIQLERELTLETIKDKVPRRYYKTGPGYNTLNGGKLFFGLEGSAYTAVVSDDKERKIDLPTALKTIWGDKVYGEMPTTLRKPLEDYKWGVTIEPPRLQKMTNTHTSTWRTSATRRRRN